MYQNDFSKLKEMNVHSNIVYANQCDRTSYEEIEFEKDHIAKMISTETRGVGKNRNLALSYASADICLMADDDIKYNDDMEEKILSEFQNHPDADVIVFHFESDSPDRIPEKYSKTKKWPKFARTPWGAVRIAFRLDSLRKANVWFSTLFGGGCLFPSGEDSIWIKDLRKAGLTFYVSKETIGTVSYVTSSWFTGYDEKYFYGVGACYAAISPRMTCLRFLYTVWRTHGKSDLSVSQKIKFMRYGKKGYKQMLSYNDFLKTVKS
jgi:glycosyltransferase involved in cell wall biosynthesis